MISNPSVVHLIAVFFLFGLYLVAPMCSAAATSDILIGIIRVPILDTPERLSGLFAAVYEANKMRMSESHNFTVEVYNYPHCNSATLTCDFSPAAKVSGLRDFVGNMSRFHAVMSTQFDISDVIIDKAKDLGGLPIIDPNTIRVNDFNTSNLFIMDHHIQTELAVLIRYMLMAHSCAKTGIISEGQPEYVSLVTKAFAYGGYEKPRTLDWPSSNSDVLDMFFGDPSRKCMIFLMSSASYMSFMAVVSSDPRFVPGSIKMFGWSQISTTSMRLGNSSKMFQNLFYPKALPSLLETTQLSSDYRAATTEWATSGTNITDVARNFLPGEIATGAPSTSGLMWYMRSMYGLKILASGTQRYIGALPSNITLVWQSTVDAAMNTRIWVSDYSFYSPFNKCPMKPLPQICACSIVTRVLNLRTINPTSGAAMPLTEKPLLGDVNIAAMPLSAQECIRRISVDSYPFRILTVMDVGVSSDSEAAKTEGKTSMERQLYAAVTNLNNAEPQPIRPWRLATQTFPNASSALKTVADSTIKTILDMYKPFMLVGTAYPISSASVLSVLTNNQMLFADEPLVSRKDGWNEHLVDMIPADADLIHALVSYYAANRNAYDALMAIATNEEEASLITKSLHTFQIQSPTVIVSSQTTTWQSYLQTWSQGKNTFVIAAAFTNIALGQAAVQATKTFSSLTIGLAISEPTFEEIISGIGNTNLHATSDILFASPFSAHWLAANPMNELMASLGVNKSDASYNYTYLAAAMGLAIQLANQAINFKDAAELLYTSRTTSVADMSFGPFYNDTCPDDIIKGNIVDRSCQCRKSFRELRVHSLNDRLQNQDSLRTNTYLFQMTTCGVQYQPLILPPVDETWKTILIIALVCGVAFATIVVGFVLYLCFSGRNNRHAPKDPTKPFAIVFTDIQSSTTLWSRAPAIMSDAVEHHCTIIRKLIRQHKGYEVKTIGDSFMVAFESLENSVLFSVKLQEALYADTWPAEIDQHYKEILEQAALENLSDAKAENAVNAPVDDAEYAALWNGIRVRVGLHYGLGEVRKDPTSLGYDYFGTIVNTAARVEGVGHGGQTLVTEAVLADLKKEFLSSIKAIQMSLGPQNLRGLDDKTVLVQLLPSSLAGRRFPTLRLDVENVVDETSESGTNGTTTSQDNTLTTEQLAVKLVSEIVFKGKKQDIKTIDDNLVSVRGSIDPPSDTGRNIAQQRERAAVYDLLAYYKFIEALLSTSSESWKRDAIKHMAKRWHVSSAHLGNGPSDPQRVKVVMMLAVKAMIMVRMQGKKRRQGSKASLFEGIADPEFMATASQSGLQSRVEAAGGTASARYKIMASSTSLVNINDGTIDSTSVTLIPTQFSLSGNRGGNVNTFIIPSEAENGVCK